MQDMDKTPEKTRKTLRNTGKSTYFSLRITDTNPEKHHYACTSGNSHKRESKALFLQTVRLHKRVTNLK